jgi:hypothetical protein
MGACDTTVSSTLGGTLTLLTTATRAVHHRCITATAFGDISRHRPSRRSRMDKPKLPATSAPGRRIRLRGLLREEPLICRGFSYC